MISGRSLRLSYDDTEVLKDISVTVNRGEIVSVIGPNGSGKSTLVKTLSRLLKPKTGTVLIEGKDIRMLSNREIAKSLAILTQFPASPHDFTVEEVVKFGRLPHKEWYKRFSAQDQRIVEYVLLKTKLYHLKNRQVWTLSGGERQRVWIAMALAQNPSVLILDEPTTYLDLAHQIEVMELLKKLNKELGLTIIMVLHDLNLASHYSDRIIVMKDGKIINDGSPWEVLTPELLSFVYGIQVDVSISKQTRRPVVSVKGLAYSI
ncbi:heme ABC transporter ATP-binding protein [Fervidobacterium sp.]